MNKHPFDPYHGLTRDELVIKCIQLEEENKQLKQAGTWRKWWRDQVHWITFHLEDLARI
jgi:muconolactone delta-isomerase